MSDSLKLYTITGGPCSGKTKTSRWLREMHDHIFVVPEAATMILREHEIFGKEFENPEIQRRFQHLLARQQMLAEYLSLIRAKELGKDFVVADRGILDGIAYLPGGQSEYEELTGIDVKNEVLRYDKVFWFDLPPQEIYEAKVLNNPVRYEDYKTALARSLKTRDIWSVHPNLVEISGESFQDKFNNFMDALQEGASSL